MTSERYMTYDGGQPLFAPGYDQRRDRQRAQRPSDGDGRGDGLRRSAMHFSQQTNGRPARQGSAPKRGATGPRSGRANPPGKGGPTRGQGPSRGQRPEPNRGRGPSNGGRRSSGRRGFRRIPAKVRLCIFAAVAALMVFGVVKLVGVLTAETVERFVDNVYINGVCLTGYTQDEGYQLMYDKRDAWLNTTYPLTFQGRTWEFSPASVNAKLEFDTELERAWNLGHVGDRATRRQIVAGLKQVPAEFVSEPTYDEKELDRFVAEVAKDINTEPVDAEVTLTELKPVITRASVNGWRLDEEKLKENLIQLIETGEVETELPVDEVQPTIVSENMEMRVVAKCETDVSFRGYPSRSNVRTALEHFNLFAVYPGDTVSFNEVVGPRTEAAGFKEAPEYAGDNTEMGIGGGVCQASTTLYNAVIQAGMTIITRFRHTMTVTYIAPSLDAAVNYGEKDLVFRNDTEHAIYIYTDVTAEMAKVTIYGTRPQYHYELESVIIREEPSTKTGYQDDVDGTHVYYSDEAPVLYKEGRGSCESEGWIVSYDWDTKEEVERVQVNHDIYSAGVNVYWRGIHKRDS